jgi:uncharacterized lipoprotein YbaY
MRITVRIQSSGDDRPPAGAPVTVQVRDTTFEDAPAEVVAHVVGTVATSPGPWLETVELDVAARPDSAVVWVHIDVDQDGRLSAGDYITTVAYPVPAADAAEIEVAVRRI